MGVEQGRRPIVIPAEAGIWFLCFHFINIFTYTKTLYTALNETPYESSLIDKKHKI